MPSSLVVWTVGHSNHEFEDFARLVASQQIEFLVDVRSYPYSRYASQFNRDALEATLPGRRVGYVFMGEELGGRPTRDDHYDCDGHALYRPMSEEDAFETAVQRVMGGAQRHRVALLCSESSPHDCHRRLLVGRVLADRGVELRHILPDGSIRIEHSVVLSSEGAQCSLLEDEQAPWRSTQSVSHRRRLSVSSGA